MEKFYIIPEGPARAICEKLSQASGVSTSCIDGIEAGKHSPTLFNLILICKALGTTVDGYVGVDYDN